VRAQLIFQLFASLPPAFERDERGDRLTFDVVRATDDRGFGDRFVRDERRFDFGRFRAMTGTFITSSTLPIIQK
jgi:hypothetical protein